jgi:glutamate synthase domain-containing protein 2/glutamate synthase domain-containing protein 1/glutamate synthase domain-containing protein 3
MFFALFDTSSIAQTVSICENDAFFCAPEAHMLKSSGLYDPASERDSCGVGLVARLDGRSEHRTISDGLTILRNLEHRGAVSGDGRTGDGAGLLCRIPDAFFRAEFGAVVPAIAGTAFGAGLDGPAAGAGADGYGAGPNGHPDVSVDTGAFRRGLPYGIGMFFLPQGLDQARTATTLIEYVSSREGFSILAWRDVPNMPQVLGDRARLSLPRIVQALFAEPRGGLTPGDGDHDVTDVLERRLYVLRKCLEREARQAGFALDEFSIPSLSCRTIVYKGMFVATQFESFYPDLGRADFASPFAVVHQRYSTNTFPSWPLAQPFRMIAHNGEINTLRKNVNAMRTRETTMASPLFGADMVKLHPVVQEDGSDSAMFDNVYELLVRGGRSAQHAFMMMVPEPIGSAEPIGSDESTGSDNVPKASVKRDFYGFHAAIMESWDGPAAMVFTDGVVLGAGTDRNGLRPFRYAVTADGHFIGASEAGALVLDEKLVLEKGKLGPGRMLVVDFSQAVVRHDQEIKEVVWSQRPYGRWLADSVLDLSARSGTGAWALGQPPSRALLKYFGCDDVAMTMLGGMASSASEPGAAMGTRKPVALLAPEPQALYGYFKQLFAQVTNPPIDSVREGAVMSLSCVIGAERNLLAESPLHARQLRLPHPLLTNAGMDTLRRMAEPDFRVCTIATLFDPGVPADGAVDGQAVAGFAATDDGRAAATAPAPGSRLRAALEAIGAAAELRVDEGYSLIILSDRGVGPGQAAVPALLAVAAAHRRLVASGKRHRTGIVMETGDAWEVHHIAMLIGYGASAVNPRLALDLLPVLATKDRLNPATINPGVARMAITGPGVAKPAAAESATAESAATKPGVAKPAAAESAAAESAAAKPAATESVAANLTRYTENYLAAVNKGLLKAMSRMGISTVGSFRGGGLYEAVGLSKSLVEQYFPGTESRLGGLDLPGIEADIAKRHQAAFCNGLADAAGNTLATSGDDMVGASARTAMDLIPAPGSGAGAGTGSGAGAATGSGAGAGTGSGAGAGTGSDAGAGTGSGAGSATGAGSSAAALAALWPPRLAAFLTKAVRDDDVEAWRCWADGMTALQRPAFAFRDIWELRGRTSVPLPLVEAAAGIISRFSVAAMSCGALSPEAHEVLAVGANMAGAWSNSGEGGEDQDRAVPGPDGVSRASASRQIASGRFGVTVQYVAGALELQIKAAQGAKPGEGGHLPGAKVNEYIARLRHAKPGASLISPPPHHDIYSIEDLAQLIHDLRCVNPEARIAIKLAAQAGIGAVAAGCAKAGVDCVIISSGDGGTGSAPQSSLDYVGNAWELALPEVRQVLAMNGLADRVSIQVDGRLRSGRDVVMAAILGASEFAFGTTAMMAVGCIACGQCDKDRCPAGIATQRSDLRARFAGRSEHVVRFFRMMAEDTRAVLAAIGARTLDEVAGRHDLLDFHGRSRSARDRLLEFSPLATALELAKGYLTIYPEGDEGSGPLVLPPPPAGLAAYRAALRPRFKLPGQDEALIEAVSGALSAGMTYHTSRRIRNADRSIGAALSGELVRRGLDRAVAPATIRFVGSAGQSFGAFLVASLSFELVGEANDFVGKGLSGGRISVRPRDGVSFQAESNIIAGNVCLFGATSGYLYLNGRAGERFAVRNSGAIAVVEGVGDHACEYMTGGRVTILGSTGVNFAAGMTGGVAYVHDPDGALPGCLAEDAIAPAALDTADMVTLKTDVETHVVATGSEAGARLLANWDVAVRDFVKIAPGD